MASNKGARAGGRTGATRPRAGRKKPSATKSKKKKRKVVAPAVQPTGPKSTLSRTQSHDRLRLLSDKADVRNHLIAKGLGSVRAVASASPERLTKLLGPEKAQAIQRRATSLHRYVASVEAGRLVNAQSGRPQPKELPQIPGDDLPCSCAACESAVSPAAYLADLLEYVREHVTIGGDSADVTRLGSELRQPFLSLPTSCGAQETLERQVRLCIEVLRRFLAHHPPSAGQAKAISDAEAKYRDLAYESLLLQLGTSYAELRRAHLTPDDAQALAERLGLDDGSRLAELRRPKQGWTEKDLESLFGLRRTAPVAAVTAANESSIEKWRRDRLRQIWHDEDFPASSWPSGHPVIDPDLIGPDDFRSLGSAAFVIWKSRRQWVDERLKTVGALRVEDKLNELDGLALTPEASARVDELSQQGRAAAAGTSVPLKQEQTDDMTQILVHAEKVSLYGQWRAEETAQGIKLEGKLFWASEREPVGGEWPPPRSKPLLDPDVVSLADLPERAVRTQAKAFLEQRRTRLGQLASELTETRREQGLAPAMLLAFKGVFPPTGGETEPDAMAVGLKSLSSKLADREPSVLKEAQEFLDGQLHLERDEFDQIMATHAQATPDVLSVTAAQWTRFEGLLGKVRKLRSEYPKWIEEEKVLQYWEALKARLPPWLASPVERSFWQSAIDALAKPPLVDPDLIGPDDIAEPAAGNKTYNLWKSRRATTDNISQQLKAGRAGATNKLVWLDSEIKKRSTFEASELQNLSAEEDEGYDIVPRLRQAYLDRASWSLLLSVRAFLAGGQEVTEDEWAQVDATLVQVAKIARFERWRAEEFAAGIVLGPDHFTIRSDMPPPLVAPLATYAARKAWVAVVQARTEQDAAVTTGQRVAVSAVEEKELPPLRDALLAAAADPQVPLERRAWALSKQLLIDTQASGCQLTTRVGLAIGTLQQLLLGLRNGTTSGRFALDAPTFDDDWTWMGSYAAWRAAMFVFLYPENLLIPTLREFQSPEMKSVSEALRDSPTVSPKTVDECLEPYRAHLQALQNLTIEAQCVVEVDPVSHARRLFVFGRSSGVLYWTTYDVDADDNLVGPAECRCPWVSLPGPGYISDQVLGVQPYSHGKARYLYVFLKSGSWVSFIRTSITADLGRGPCDDDRDGVLPKWSEPVAFKPPSDWPSHHRGLVLQSPTRSSQWAKPSIWILLPHGVGTDTARHNSNAIFVCSLDDAGAEWGAAEALGSLTPILLNEPSESSSQDNAQSDHPAAQAGLLIGSAGTSSWIELATNKHQSYSVDVPVAGDLVVTLESSPPMAVLSVKEGTAYKEEPLSDTYPGRAILVGVPKGPLILRVSRPPKVPLVRFRITIEGPPETHDLLDAIQGQGPPMLVTRREVSNSAASVKRREYLLWTYSGESGEDLTWRRTVIDAIDDSDHYLRTIPAGTAHTGGWQSPSGQTPHSRVAVFWRTSGATKARIYDDRGALKEDRLEAVAGPTAVVPPGSWGPLMVSGTGTPPVEYHWTLRRLSGRLVSQPLGKWFEEEELDILRPAGVSRVVDPLYEHAPSMDLALGPLLDTPGPLLELHLTLLRRGSPWWTAYAEEALYHLPVLVALYLQQSGQFTAALAWFRAVYDYATVTGRRKRYPGLVLEQTLGSGLQRPEEWLSNPLNPHALAATRPLAYTRYTIMAIVGCLLEYADAEFTRDTAESLPRARVLYETALDLLDADDIRVGTSPCEELLWKLESELASKPLPGPWTAIGASLVKSVRASGNLSAIRKADEIIRKNLTKAPDSWVTKALEQVSKAPAATTMEKTLDARMSTAENAYTPWTKDPDLKSIVDAASILGAPQGWIPTVSFCVPSNPVFTALTLRPLLNLDKMRRCRNIAGVERELAAYAAPTDTTSGMPIPTLAGQLVLPGLSSYPPTQYRYRTLIERARRLVTLAQQVEAAMLAAIEKADNDEYGQLTARQNVQVTRANVTLQEIRQAEAAIATEIARLERETAQIREEYYADLVERGLNDWENAYLTAIEVAAVAYEAAALGAIAASFALGAQAAEYAQLFGGKAKEMALATAQARGSFERSAQERRFQLQLAGQGVDLANVQTRAAEKHADVVDQERRIADLQASNAEDIVEYLSSRFANAELYQWMGTILRQQYAYFLQQATAMAQTAARQLAFERQATLPPFIQSDYWAVAGTSGSMGEDQADRRGLTGAERLVVDIEKLDGHAFETDTRRLNLTRSFSLASMMPIEFQMFRETGVLRFSTPMELFDRDFPGHYLRLIQRVRVSVQALVPPVEGIRATLTSSRNSRVVVAGDIFQSVVVERGPDQIAFMATQNASGIFELDPQPDLLRPFEGIGVDTSWELRLPRAANHFDYQTIADVVFTVEYSALMSFDYREQVIRELPSQAQGDLPLSFRDNLSDPWYELHNPEQSTTPMAVRFKVDRDRFPGNLDNIKIDHVALYFSRTADFGREVTIERLQLTQPGLPAPVGGGAVTVDGVASTRKSNAAAWLPLKGKSPFGEWELALTNDAATRDAFRDDAIKGVLLAISYSADVPAWEG